MLRRRAARWAAASLLAALAAAASLDLGDAPLRLDLGGPRGSFLVGDWTRVLRAGVDPPATADGVTSFYYRSAGQRSGVRLPVVPREGPLTLVIRGRSSVRHVLSTFVDSRPAGEALIPTTPWQSHAIELEGVRPGEPLEVRFALKGRPLVAGDHGATPTLLVDWIELRAPGGLRLTPLAAAGVGLLPLVVLAVARLSRVPTGVAFAAAAGAALVTPVLVRAAPLPFLMAAPRLVPVALLAGLTAWWALGRVPALPLADRRGLALVVALGSLLHGGVVFSPGHNPPDLDTHAVRTRDFEYTTWSYRSLLEYGSHLPTVSQQEAPATGLFGERALVPYSPVPYLLYYALERAGLELEWAMTASTAALMMLVTPLVWIAGRHLWTPFAGWVAALLFVLDLPVWHHLGRAHLPASLGNALGVAALLVLVWKGSRVSSRSPARVAATAGLLAAGALGYTSMALLFGLLGTALLVLLALDARSIPRPARLGLASAFVAGGLLAGILYYFHYVPGLLEKAGVLEAEAPELFDPRTFLIFHNESRQSMRIWLLGSWWLIGAGLLAAPTALWRARADARPVPLAWLLSWALFVLLKEPFFFPKLLRWAKEEQFVSPLMDLFVAGAVASLPRPWMRWSGAIVAIGWALRLQLRDFLLHANSLSL